MFRTRATDPKVTARQHDIKTGPAPIGGLNTRDSLAAMPPTDSQLMVNWFPDVGGLTSRGGYRVWAEGFTDDEPVRTIMCYLAPGDTFPGGTFATLPSVLAGTVFAATDTDIWDVTTATDAPVSSKSLSGDPQAGWLSHSTLTNSAGSFLLVCSETDGYFYYDGATWTTPVAGVAPGDINGVDPADLVHVSMWKKRAWFVERDSTRAWFLGADAITGTASEFDFGPVFSKGGYLAFLANWTIDAGEGIDDFLVAVSSNGDVVIYQGTDPTDPDKFGLVGRWYVGQIPVGRRNYAQFGGDLLILSTEGLFPVSLITRGGGDLLSANGAEYSSKIKPTLGARARTTFTEKGWQVALNSSQRMLLVSAPDEEYSENVQFCMNTALNAWTQFTGIPVLCYGETPGWTLSGGADGKVYLLFVEGLDNVQRDDSGGDPVYCAVQFPFNYFDAPAIQKTFHMARATFITAVRPGYTIDVNVDFSYTPPQPAAPNPTAAGITTWDGTDAYDAWDVGYWDGVPGDRGVVFSDWRSVSGLGFAAAATIGVSTTTSTLLVSADYMLTMGGPL